MKTYTHTAPDGTVLTRTSRRENYTHAVVHVSSLSGKWMWQLSSSKSSVESLARRINRLATDDFAPQAHVVELS